MNYQALVTGLAVTAALASVPAVAQDTREMDAHVHGVSTLEIAVDGTMVEMNLTSPGMDIVGFEYEATSAEDYAAIGAAVGQLSRPTEILSVPDAAGCALTEVLSHIHTGDDDHGHDDHAEGEDHAEDGDHDDHAEEADAQADAGEDEGGESHTEFHARYVWHCDAPDALTSVTLTFFDVYPNAEEIEAQYVTGTGQGSAELTPASAELTFE